MAEAPTTASAPPTEQTPSVNGGAAVSEVPSQANGDAESASKDVEMAEPPATTEVNAPDGNGTTQVDTAEAPEPTDTNGAASKSKRKSTGGVPEHKTKKLNKKKSMPSMNLDLEPGDYVWARLKGYPPWPAICCDESMLPEVLLGNRPVSTKRPDGTYREDYADGGKNVKDRTYPVMFFSTNEFAWMANTALTRLEPSECEDAENKKLSVALKAAYKIAAEGNDLDHFKELLRQYDEEMRTWEQEEREKAERKAAEAAEKAEKKAEKERRKSKAADEMDVDGEGKPSKKRKKGDDGDADGPKAKKPLKVKLSAKESTGDLKKSKPKKKVEEATPVMSEEERLARREKAVFYLRHKLQRCFLTPNTPPDANEMDEMATHFTSLESHKDLEPQVIRKTKIHKVLKNIVRLDSIPREDEFHFKTRSADMLNHWNNALSASTDGDTSVVEPSSATNGEAKQEETPKAEEAEPKAEEKPEEKPAVAAEPEAPKPAEPSEPAAPAVPEKVTEPAAAPVETTAPGNAAGDEASDAPVADAPPATGAEPEKMSA